MKKILKKLKPIIFGFMEMTMRKLRSRITDFTFNLRTFYTIKSRGMQVNLT